MVINRPIIPVSAGDNCEARTRFIRAFAYANVVINDQLMTVRRRGVFVLWELGTLYGNFVFTPAVKGCYFRNYGQYNIVCP